MSATGKDNFWGVTVRQIRREQGLSQRRLALQAGVNRSTLRRIEQGEASNDIGVIEALLSCLGYELEVMHREAIARRLELEENPSSRSRQAMRRLMSMPVDLCGLSFAA